MAAINWGEREYDTIELRIWAVGRVFWSEGDGEPNTGYPLHPGPGLITVAHLDDLPSPIRPDPAYSTLPNLRVCKRAACLASCCATPTVTTEAQAHLIS